MPGDDGKATAAELAERIKALKAATTIDAAPERHVRGGGIRDRTHPPPDGDGSRHLIRVAMGLDPLSAFVARRSGSPPWIEEHLFRATITERVSRTAWAGACPRSTESLWNLETSP